MSNTPRRFPFFLVGTGLFVVGAAVLLFFLYWLRSSAYRMDRLLAVLDDPSLLWGVNPLRLVVSAFSIIAIFSSPFLVLSGILQRTRSSGRRSSSGRGSDGGHPLADPVK